MRQVIDADMLRTMSLFTRITHATLQDAMPFNDALLFIVGEGQLGRALGRQRANVAKLERLLNRKLKIVEFSPDKLQFVVNLMSPLRVSSIQEDDGVVTVTGPDHKTKGLMIGAGARNLRRYEEIARRYFPVKEIKVR